MDFKSKVNLFKEALMSYDKLYEIPTNRLALYSKFTTTKTEANLNTELNSRSSRKNPILAKRSILIQNKIPKEHLETTIWSEDIEDPEKSDVLNVPFACADYQAIYGPEGDRESIDKFEHIKLRYATEAMDTQYLIEEEFTEPTREKVRMDSMLPRGEEKIDAIIKKALFEEYSVLHSTDPNVLATIHEIKNTISNLGLIMTEAAVNYARVLLQDRWKSVLSNSTLDFGTSSHAYLYSTPDLKITPLTARAIDVKNTNSALVDKVCNYLMQSAYEAPVNTRKRKMVDLCYNTEIYGRPTVEVLKELPETPANKYLRVALDLPVSMKQGTEYVDYQVVSNSYVEPIKVSTMFLLRKRVYTIYKGEEVLNGLVKANGVSLRFEVQRSGLDTVATQEILLLDIDPTFSGLYIQTKKRMIFLIAYECRVLSYFQTGGFDTEGKTLKAALLSIFMDEPTIYNEMVRIFGPLDTNKFGITPDLAWGKPSLKRLQMRLPHSHPVSKDMTARMDDDGAIISKHGKYYWEMPQTLKRPGCLRVDSSTTTGEEVMIRFIKLVVAMKRREILILLNRIEYGRTPDCKSEQVLEMEELMDAMSHYVQAKPKNTQEVKGWLFSSTSKTRNIIALLHLSACKVDGPPEQGSSHIYVTVMGKKISQYSHDNVFNVSGNNFTILGVPIQSDLPTTLREQYQFSRIEMLGRGHKRKVSTYESVLDKQPEDALITYGDRIMAIKRRKLDTHTINVNLENAIFRTKNYGLEEAEDMGEVNIDSSDSDEDSPDEMD